jgi:hypothetical protein
LALLNLKLPNGQFVIPTPQTVDPSQPFATQGSSSFSIPCTFNEDQLMTNLDFNQSNKSTLFARFFFANSDQNITFPTPNLGGTSSPGFPQPTGQRFRNASLTHNYIFSTNVLNQAEIGYHRQLSDVKQSEAFNFSDIGATVPATDNATPAIAIQGTGTLGGNGQSVKVVQNTYVAQDTLSWVRGRHSFRFGGGATYAQDDIANFQFLGGLIFPTFPDFLLGQSAAQNGTPFSNILGSIDLPGLLQRHYRTWDSNAFVQDNFKVTRNLTLNLGFRYERLGAVSDALGRNALFDPASADPNPPATGSLAGFIVPSNFKGTTPPGVVSSGNSIGIRGDGQNTLNPHRLRLATSGSTKHRGSRWVRHLSLALDRPAVHSVIDGPTVQRDPPTGRSAEWRSELRAADSARHTDFPFVHTVLSDY